MVNGLVLRQKLQESPIFLWENAAKCPIYPYISIGKTMVSCRCSLKPIHWDGKTTCEIHVGSVSQKESSSMLQLRRKVLKDMWQSLSSIANFRRYHRYPICATSNIRYAACSIVFWRFKGINKVQEPAAALEWQPPENKHATNLPEVWVCLQMRYTVQVGSSKREQMMIYIPISYYIFIWTLSITTNPYPESTSLLFHNLLNITSYGGFHIWGYPKMDGS